jgi:indolepyruvate ferredoxin oxidoreductase, beta subunit
MNWNAIITGIGGQGVVTLAMLVRRAAIAAGYRLTGFDNRGGAQRLGHVAAVIRLSEETHPLGSEIPPGQADLLISLEAAEGLRFAGALSPHRSAVWFAPRLVIPTNERRLRHPFLSRAECAIGYAQRAREVFCLAAEELAKETFGRAVAGNLIMLAAALSGQAPPGLLPHLVALLSEADRAAWDLGCAAAGQAERVTAEAALAPSPPATDSTDRTTS